MIESWKELFLFGPEIVISQRVPNGGGGVSQLSLFDVKSEKRSKRRSKNSRYGVQQLPLFDVK